MARLNEFLLDDADRRAFLRTGWVAGAGLLVPALTYGAQRARTEPAKGETEEDVAPPEDLMREHGVLKRVLLVYDEAIRRIDARRDLPPEAVRDGATIIRTFIEDYHEKLEEDYLFPRFEKAGRLTDLTKVLRAQHQAGRRVTEQITGLATAAVVEGRAARRAGFASCCSSSVRMYAPHEAREDTVLFPALPQRRVEARVRRARRGLREEGAPALRRGRVREDGRPRGHDRKIARHLRSRAVHAEDLRRRRSQRRAPCCWYHRPPPGGAPEEVQSMAVSGETGGSAVLRTHDVIDVLWITAGLGCDGDTIAMTAATQPSIEDLLLGALPWVPRLRLHNAFLDPRNGDEFLRPFHRAARGEIDPFILVVEGSIPDETNKAEGYWAAFGTDAADRPADHDVRVDRSAGAATPGRWWPSGPARPTAASTRWRAIRPAAWACPITSAGRGSRKAGIPIVCVPGCPDAAGQPHRDAALPAAHGGGPRADDPAGRCAAADVAVRPDRARGLRSRRLLRAGASSPTSYGSPLCIVKLGCWGPVVQCNVGKRGWMGGIGGCPNVGGICIGCTMPGFPDKFMPFMDQPPGSMLSSHARDDVRHVRFTRCGGSRRRR